MNILQKILKPTCWKIKAIERRIEIKRLNQRIKELEISRDTWRSKANERNSKIEILENQKKEIENELKKN